MTTIDFDAARHLPVMLAERALQIGDRRLMPDDTVDGGPIGVLGSHELRDALAEYERQTRGGYRPQLAALAFFMTGHDRALDGYFPLLGTLEAAGRTRFYDLAAAIVGQSGFDLHLLDVGRNTVALPADMAFLVAGQLAEIFFYRQDILERLLATPRHIRLYTTPGVFAEDGGAAGGCYSPDKECVQLLAARLYEGFYTPMPGVSPFLHEFGHLLDHFDAGRAAMGRSAGLLPGMLPSDGPIYTPEARALFLKGKQLEIARYEQLLAGAAPVAATLPLGHPYVFQNDTEFIAGYTEMFFRNPHAFARQNPDLYAGFATLLRQDPRAAWQADFPFYVEENRRFYLSGQRPSPHHLTLEARG
jgi:hypothetical protein